jgi:hypothetical protein
MRWLPEVKLVAQLLTVHIGSPLPRWGEGADACDLWLSHTNVLALIGSGLAFDWRGRLL